MANSANATTAGGLTRGKAILIAVLGVVLLGVLYLQFGSSGGGGGMSEPSKYVPRRAPVVQASATATAGEKGAGTAAGAATVVATVSYVDSTKWKSPSLAEVVDYDPFALPDAFPKAVTLEAAADAADLVAAAAAEDSRRLAEAILQVKTDLQALQQAGVQVIVRQGDQYVAMIGDRTVHVGEEIQGFTVTRIDPNGVVVERKPAE